jgi:hypothetical protein
MSVTRLQEQCRGLTDGTVLANHIVATLSPSIVHLAALAAAQLGKKV